MGHWSRHVGERVRVLHSEVPSVMAALSLGGATVETINTVEGAAC